MIKEGEKAPDFTLDSDDGKRISLSDFQGKNIVLYFYPKDNTPGCTKEAIEFQKLSRKFGKINAVILALQRLPFYLCLFAHSQEHHCLLESRE